jgi:hypothetical protein
MATKYCMSCGGTNLPDAFFCGKCAAPFPGAPVKPAATPPPKVAKAAVVVNDQEPVDSDDPNYRAPIPSLSRRDRGRRIPQRPQQLEIEGAVEEEDDGTESVDSVPDISRLEVSIAPLDESAQKVDLGNLLTQGQTDFEKRNPGISIITGKKVRARKSK